MGRGRPSHGLTERLGSRVQPVELQMVRDVAAHMGGSSNLAVRWAIRYAWQHATSTTDHTACPGNSPCASATRGLMPGKGRQCTPQATDGQMLITHQATVE